MGKGAVTILATLLLLLAAPQFSPHFALANDAITSEALTLTVYLDGFVLVNYELELNQSYPTVNATFLGEAYEDMIVIDEQNLPLDYSLANGEALIQSLGASQVKISYFTQDLTSKTGKYWTLSTNVSTSATVVLPEDASIISLNNVPELIESSNGQVTLVMPLGTIEITYIAERSVYPPTQSYETWPFILILAFPIIASAVWLLIRKKPQKPEPPKDDEVDIDKLFERHKDLRQEEVQVIHFLAESHGTAFEAELYAKLNLPRTTTWRLIKRLQKMEIVDIQKSRRQNIVSIKKKYMKKQHTTNAH